VVRFLALKLGAGGFCLMVNQSVIAHVCESVSSLHVCDNGSDKDDSLVQSWNLKATLWAEPGGKVGGA
jgi:hypothetical protein